MFYPQISYPIYEHSLLRVLEKLPTTDRMQTQSNSRTPAQFSQLLVGHRRLDLSSGLRVRWISVISSTLACCLRLVIETERSLREMTPHQNCSGSFLAARGIGGVAVEKQACSSDTQMGIFRSVLVLLILGGGRLVNPASRPSRHWEPRERLTRKARTTAERLG